MKTKLKNRIVSALLALSMLASFLPAGLVAPVYAALSTVTTGHSVKVNEDGTFTVTFKVPGMEGASLGNYAFALVPDVTSRGEAAGIPSNEIGGGFHPQLGSAHAFNSALVSAGAPSSAYYFSQTTAVESLRYDSSGNVTFTGTMPKSLAETIQGLIGYTKGDGTQVSAADSSIPMVALLWGQGGPTFAGYTGTWSGSNPAVLEISGGPIDIYGPSPNPLNDLQTEFKNHPLTLTNKGGENAIVSKVVFGAPKLAGIGSAYYWALWYDKDGVLTPLCGDASGSNAALKNIGDLITIAPGESVVVYMQRRQATTSLEKAITVGSGTNKIPCTNTTIPVNGGTITLTYASEKDGNYTFTDGSADTSWSYKVGGGYNNTTLSVTADQWSTGASNTGTVKRSGTGADPLAITNIALDSNTNAKVTLSGFAEDGSVTVTSGQNQAITGKTATGDLSVKLEPGSTDDAGTWNGNLTITYDNGRTVKVVLTVKVDSVMITDVVTIQKDGTKWTDVPSGTVFTVQKNGIDAPVTGTLSGGEVSFTGLKGGSYNIYADDVDTGVKLLKVGGQVANATVDYYTYTLTAGADGTVSDSKVTFPSGTSGVFLKGTEIAPTGTPNPGYTGPSWSTTPPETLNAKTELTASFTAKAIKLTTPDDVSLTYGSTLSTPVTWQVTDATYSAEDSITYTYTVSAPSGVTFSDYFTISPASGTATSGANTPVTLTAVEGKTPPTGTYTVQVTGESGYNGTTDTLNPIFSITVGAAASASVKILKDGSAYTGYDSSAAANKVTLNGTIDGSYSNTTATYTFSNLVPEQTYNVYQGGADTGKTVTAASGSTTGNTAEIKYWTVSMGAGANVGSKWLDTSASSTSGSGDSYIVKDGGDVYAHATPATGYVGKASWSYSATTHGGSDPTSGNSIHITNITGTLTVTPSYSQYEGTITVNLDGSAYTAFSGTVSVGGEAATKGGNGSTWSYTGATETAAVTTSDGTPSPAVNVTGTGRNATVNYYSLAISAGTGGTVNSEVNGNYLTGKSVTITATAASGFSFDGWYEPGGSTAVSKTASYSVSMTKKQELEARFKAAAITYNGGSITYIYNNGTPTSTTKDVKGTPNIAGVTFTSYQVASGSSMPDGLTLNADGTISGTPTKAGSYTVEVEATASNGMKPTANWTFTVKKVKLTAPVIAVKNNVSVANGSDGAITVTNPNYPADAGVTYQLYKGTTSTGKGDPTSWEYTGLNAGDYYVQATLGSTNYEWNTTGGNNGKSNTVKITEPGVNSPSLTKTPTYEKNTAVAGSSAAVFDFDAGDWSGLSKLTIDGKDVSLSDITVSAGKTGSITIPATVLDGLSLTNGNKTVTATFSRTGINPLTATASSTLKVQTTYIVSFDVNEPAGKTAPTTPTIANQTATGTSAPNFAWANISNNLSDSSIPGYSFRGWAATEDATTATWTAENYQPTNMDTTLFAVWLANEVSVTTTLNGSNNSGRTITLWKDNKATTFTGSTDASGKVTFREVPAGTYQIHDATGDTGLTVTAAAGNTGSARANTVHYYTVEYLAVTSAADHGTYAGGSTPASAEIITNGSAARRTVTLPGTTPDTNYTRGDWTLTPAGTTAAGAGTAPVASATTWVANSSYTGTSKITLKPNFVRSGASITVNVNRNGSKATETINVTLTGPSGYAKTVSGITSGTAVFDSLATAGRYTAGVDGWTTSGSETKSASITASYADLTITLNYFDYHFNANKPTGAAGTVGNVPADPTAPVLTGASVTAPTGTPTLTGYTFKGWATSATGTPITWPATITAETTFYAIWDADTINLSTGSGQGANEVNKIINFTSPAASGTGHTASDFTYTVEGGSTSTKDGVTITAGASGFTATGTPTRVAAAGNEITFNVKAVSKLNGQEASSTIKITVEPTFTVKYEWNAPSGVTISDAVPTDSNRYIASRNTTAFGLGNSVSATSANPNLGSYTLKGWTYTSGTLTNSTPTNAGTKTGISFSIASAAAAQGITATGGELVIRALWVGEELSLSLSDLDAVYNMNATSVGKDKWDASLHQWIVDGVDLEAGLSNGSNGARTYSLTDVTGNASSFLEISGSKLQLKSGVRIGNAGTYTFDVTVSDPGTEAKTATARVTLTVAKAMPVIEGLAITAGSHYAGDKTLDAMTYVRVHDPYLASGDTGYTLMDGSTNNKAGWGATNAALQAGNLEYTFMYTPADAENYEKPSEKKTIEVLTRSISLQVQDDDKNLNWSPDYKNENEPTYSPTANWVSITVTIRNPMGNNSPIEELTAQQTAGDTEAFRNIEVTPLDSLAVGDTGVAILTFEVNTHASGSHTLTYEFTGVAGKGLPSEKQAKATYTYTTAAKAATLSTPVPDLNIVEKDKGGDYKDENGAAVNKNNGGIHLHIPAIAEDTGANNPVKEYEVTISGTGWTLPTFTIPATGSATGYDKYWDAGLDGSKPVPDKEYTVTVRAITKDSNLYSSSEKGMDTEKAGYRVLTVADWGKLTNRVFNGTTQNGGSLTSPEGVGAIAVQYSDDYNGRNGDSANLEGSKTHVNVTAGAGTNHEYAVFVTVAKGALYLPIEEATLYTPADAWQITQAPATLAVKASNQGKVGQTTELDPEGTASKVTYTTTATTADAYGGSDVTSYYDLTYTIKSGPNTDSSAITGSSFTPKAEGTYVITVHGEYGAKATDQFKADVGRPADKEITVTVADKLLTALEVIGDDREATYGDSNAANFYDASDNVIAKKMGLDDIQVKLTWDSGEEETLTLEEFENRGQITTNFGEISDKKVVFPSAGVATVTMEYSGQSDTIKLTLNPRGLTYHSFGSDKIYDGKTSVNKPGVALDDNQIFATETSFGEDDVDLNQTEGLTYKLDSAEVGPGRKVQVEGTPKLVGADAGFYIPTEMTEGEVEILPAGFTVKVQTITPTVGTTIPTTITQDPTSDNHVTDNAGNPLPAGTTVAIKWEWNDNGEWKEVTGDKTFQKGTEYRPVVIVTPPSNYQMDTKQPKPGYTINGDTHGENGAEITIDGNVGTFIGAPTKLSSTPILQFRDESSSTAKVNFTRRLSSITEGGTLSPTNIPITFLNINEEIFDVELAVEGDLAQYLTLTPASFDHMTEGQEAVYTLDLSAFDTNSVGTHTLTINAKGAEVAGGSKNIEASYTISFTVSSKPTGGGGTVTIEMPVVTYWVSDNGFTNDLTAEKMSRRGAKPSFVPKITAIEGLKFLGWSESDPTKIKDGTLPTLVDPLTFSITDDKTFYAIYEAVPAGHAHYVIGFPDGTFGPDHPITRGQVATIIARACLEDFAEGSDYGNPGNYNDVEEHWANSAIAFCSLKGVFTGYEDGTFRPDRYISRQELAAVVARLAGVQPNEGLNFVDSGDVANWALNGVYTNVANGWVNGYEDNTFRPLNDITRAETVKIFNGYLHRGVDAEGLSDLTEYVHSGVASNTGSGNEENKEYMTWPDVSKSHWAYFEVIEAANDHDFHWKDATQAVPPEHWDAAFIDDVWRYYDNENDGGEDVGKETPVFTVTYVVNGHGVTYSNTTEQVKIYESPSVEGLPAVVVDEGYYLAGWSEKDPAIHELTEDDIVDPTAHYIEGDKTFYAVFKSFEEYVPETVIVTYVVSKNGETYDAITSEVVWNTMPEQGTIPVAVADAGFIFAGWSDTDPSSGNVTLVDPASTVVTEDRTFYAVFQPIQQPSEPVVYARTKYIGGFEDGTFRPDEAITRAAVAKIIAELLRYDASQTYDADFVDLENHWAKNVIAYCVQRGVMGGYEDGTFRPDGAITRQEFAVIISRLAGTQSNEGLTFTDVDAIAPWALDGVYTAYVHGWINGYEDGTFLPEKVMTRAETVKIFNAYLGRSANVEEINATTGYTVWNDVPATHWAYYEIVEASNNWGDLPQQDQPAPEEGQVSGENIDETVPVEGDDATAGQPTEGEDPTQTPGEGAQQPGEGETSDQPENGGQDEIQPDNGEDAATPNEGEDPALPNDEENEDNAGEGEDAPTDGDDQ